MATNPKNVSRADQVRARRKIEPIQRKPIPRSENRVSRDASNASRVISRHSTYRPGSSNTYSTRKRKPVYLSTSTPGSEIRLPSLPQFSFSWRALSGLLVGVALVLIYMMLNSNTFTVNTVNLSGGVRVPSEEIKSVLNVTGESIIFVRPSQVEEQILATFPDIKNAHVSVVMPDSLKVVVEERIPAILWVENGEELFWIDQDGFTFTVRGEANLPIRVYANATPPQNLGYVESTLVALEEVAEPLEASGEKISPIDPNFVLAIQKLNSIKPADVPMIYDTKNGLGWADPHGWQVFFGTKTDDIDLKLTEYNHIVQAILDRNLQPVLISMEFLHAPFYRLEH
ncbi:MAG TPA: FtsQ-type POTRA domain-containing protein [Chloroflexi bacterium]|jgi:hypothetical protein|nr:FtsQ-type POTRA domain-containing protein [Chloroflexota bacterium]